MAWTIIDKTFAADELFTAAQWNYPLAAEDFINFSVTNELGSDIYLTDFELRSGDIVYAQGDTLSKLCVGSVPKWIYPDDSGCAYCGGDDYRKNMREQWECAGCGAPKGYGR